MLHYLGLIIGGIIGFSIPVIAFKFGYYRGVCDSLVFKETWENLDE